MEHLQSNDLTLNEETFIVTLRGKEINLSRREFDLLAYLMKNTHRIVTKEELAEKLFGDVTLNTVEVYVKYLRNKIGSGKIETRRGFGYRMAR